jgi:hypothetical protein
MLSGTPIFKSCSVPSFASWTDPSVALSAVLAEEMFFFQSFEAFSISTSTLKFCFRKHKTDIIEPVRPFPLTVFFQSNIRMVSGPLFLLRYGWALLVIVYIVGLVVGTK